MWRAASQRGGRGTCLLNDAPAFGMEETKTKTIHPRPLPVPVSLSLVAAHQAEAHAMRNPLAV